MALVAWWKLNGDLQDSSMYGRHGTNNGSTISDSGKIGNCYSFSSSYVSFPNPLVEKQHFSIAFWAKTNAVSNQCFGCTRTAIGNGVSIFILTTNRLRFDTGKAYQWNTAYNMPVDEWVHIAVTKDNNYKKLYVNGQFHSSTSAVGDMTTLSDMFVIGASHSNGSGFGNYLDGYVNDYRIYDHALSEKEIKELAKAKILHYKFDDFQEPTVNLLYYPYEGSASHEKGTNFTWTLNHPVSAGEEYVITADFLRNLDHGGRIYCMFRLEDASGNLIDGSMKLVPDWSSVAGEPLYHYFNNDIRTKSIGTWYRYTNPIIKIPAEADGGQIRWIRFSFTTGGDETTTTSFKNAQFEKKPYATPFVVGERSGTVYDCSGYDNNAELDLATTPRWTDNAKIGSGAYDFGGSTTKSVTIPSVPKLPLFTLSAWVYNVQGDSRQSILRNFWEIVGTSITFWSYDFANDYWRTSPTGVVPYGQWTHIATTWDGSIIRHYANGVKVYEDARVSSGTSQNFYSIGGYSGRVFCGKLDDLRIYATTLSDEDIKELYQTRASLDDKGNLYVHEISTPAINGCPPFREWSLSGGAYLDGDILVLPKRDAIAHSPFIYIGENDWRWSADFYSDEPRPDYTDMGGLLQGSSYYDINKDSTKNTSGWASNGNAQRYPIKEWTRKTWAYSGGNNVRYLRINISNNASYTAESYKVRNPMVTVNGMWQTYVSYNSSELLNTVPSCNISNAGLLECVNISELGPTNGLVAYYPLNGNANDYSGNNLHGTVYGAVPTAGIHGLAYSFDGVDDYIRTGTIRESDALTISLWERDDGIISGARLYWGYASDKAILNFYGTDGKLQWYLHTSGGRTGYKTTSGTVKIGDWNHLVLVYDGSVVRFFINGKVDAVEASISGISSSASLNLGTNYNNTGNFFRGSIADVRIYNRALTAEEVQILYNVTKPNRTPIQVSSDGTLYLGGELNG